MGTVVDLLDREDAVAVLAGALEQAARSAGRMVVVQGVAGIGKTRLIDRFVAGLPAGTQILRGGCDDLVTPRPLGPFHDIGRQVGGELGAMIREGASRDRVLHGLLDHLSRVPPPVVMVIEDIQWADEATLDLLVSLGRRLADRPLLMVTSLRTDEDAGVSGLVRTFANVPPGAIVRLDLAPLSPDAVARLASGTAIDPTALHELTGGNPFFVTEVLARGELGPTPSVAAAVAARVAALPDGTRELLELMSVVPSRVPIALLDRLEPAWPVLLEPAERRDIVTLDDDAMAFRHELARAAIEQTLSRLAARRLHARVLRVLEGLEVEPSRLVHHADLAGDEDAIVAHAPPAARIARQAQAHREAVAHYRRALTYPHRFTAPELARMRMELARSSMASDAPPTALAAIRASVETARATGDARLTSETLSWLSRMESWAGNRHSAEAAADEAVALLEPHGPTASLALAQAARAYVALAAWDGPATYRWADRCIATAQTVADQALEVLGEVYRRSVHLSETGDVEPLSASITAAGRLRERETQSQGYLGAVTALHFRRDYERADRWCDEALAHCDEHEQYSWAAYFHALRATIRFEMGRWRDVEPELAAARVRHQLPVWAVCHASVTRGRLLARTGSDGAREELEGAWQTACQLGVPQLRYPAAVALTELDWLDGCLSGMRDELAEVREEAARLGWQGMIGEIEVWAARAGATDVRPDRTARAFRLQLEGRHPEAAEAWRALGCPYERAECLVLSDDPTLMLDGLAILDELGAAPLARRTRARLRELGVTNVPRGPQRETRANPGGLTARQLEVLDLLEAGLTNAQIAERLVLSTRTVDHHVSAILTKLGAATRQEAVSRARDLR
jgi:DNA-binding CsgD family transcriptional regulator/tetratricopeptide (TPR) repeat protein